MRHLGTRGQVKVILQQTSSALHFFCISSKTCTPLNLYLMYYQLGSKTLLNYTKCLVRKNKQTKAELYAL